MPADRYHQTTSSPPAVSTKYPHSPFSSSTRNMTNPPLPELEFDLYPILSQLRIHVVPIKLESSVTSIHAQIHALGGKVSRIEDCTFAITALKGRPRLERVLGSKWVDEKDILSANYVTDLYEACVKYKAASYLSKEDRVSPLCGMEDIKDSRVVCAPPPTLPSRDGYLIPGTGTKGRLKSTQEEQSVSSEEDEMPDLEPLSEDIDLRDIPRYAVHRCSPLICPNQDIIDAIRPIFQMREYESPDQKNANILSYKRSMSILKAVPRRIKSGIEAERLVNVGPKVAKRIDEYLRTGRIEEAEMIKADKRFQTLNVFSTVFTVGTQTAVKLYDMYDCHTLEELTEYYVARELTKRDPQIKEERKIDVDKQGRHLEHHNREAEIRRKTGRMSQAEIVREWLRIREELDSHIPRDEVEEISRCVKENLDAILVGCEMTITGGYRRGKTECNDVDLVFRPPENVNSVGLLKELYTRLADLDIISHVLRVSKSTYQNNFDGLDKTFVILRLPPKPGSSQLNLHRRVDLIFAPEDRYPQAILGWSGSMMFERDLRRHAKNIGMKFGSNGLSYRSTGEELHPKTEREIFKILGLRYVPPKWRNADG